MANYEKLFSRAADAAKSFEGSIVFPGDWGKITGGIIFDAAPRFALEERDAKDGDWEVYEGCVLAIMHVCPTTSIITVEFKFGEPVSDRDDSRSHQEWRALNE